MKIQDFLLHQWNNGRVERWGEITNLLIYKVYLRDAYHSGC
jgi:hypothetical protein